MTSYHIKHHQGHPFVFKCKNETCGKTFVITEDIRQKYCSKACSLAQANRRRKRRREQIPQPIFIEGFPMGKEDYLHIEMEPLNDIWEKTFPPSFKEATSSLADGLNKTLETLRKEPELQPHEQLLVAIQDMFAQQLEFILGMPSEDAFRSAIKDCIIGVANAVHLVYPDVDMNKFYQGSGYHHNHPEYY